MSKAQKAVEAIEEFLDVVDLGTDDIPNRAQLPQFAVEGGQAGMKLVSLATDLDKKEYDEAAEALGIASLGQLFTNKAAFSDGSKIAFTMSVIEAQVEETEEPPVG